MSILLTHSGKQHSYQSAKAMYDLGMLYRFYTSSYITNDYLQKYLLKNGDTYWTRRFIEGLPGNKVEANWLFEVKEIIYRKLFGKSLKTQKCIYDRDVLFDKYIANKIKKIDIQKNGIDLYWGFQGSCYQSIKAANEKGLLSICELATAHAPYAKKILGEEILLHPEWSDSIDNLVFPLEYEKRLCQEPHIAQKVIAASEFTIQSLKYDRVDSGKIIYLPLGADIIHIAFNKQLDKNFKNRPLKILYAGTVTQRKGIKYLLDAMKLLPTSDFELHIIGGIQGSGEAFKKYDCYTYHLPVSQKELFEIYHQFDVFVLPSVFEGFGLVLVEAMAAGLPIITTSHTMGPEIVNEDKNGYIIPIRDIYAIKESLIKFRNKTYEEFYEMQLAARNSAINFSWDSFQIKLQTVLNSLKGC